ncbi:MAG: DUF2073 domain-containing protein [Candidatus Altiarchaeales archaeon]|nr:DUF2073 domain-containing protein [Candidatus Altiarchaeales archaeon]
MDIEIEFITSDVLEGKTPEEKMEFLLEKIKDDKIIVVEESLSSQEEVLLIEATMKQISKRFPGIEVSTLRERSAEGFKEKLIKMLGGRTGGLTVIGPSKLVKKIKKEPQKISILAGEKDKEREK